MKLGRKAEDDLIPFSSFPFCTSFFVLWVWSKSPEQPLVMDVSQAQLDSGASESEALHVADPPETTPARVQCGQPLERG